MYSPGILVYGSGGYYSSPVRRATQFKGLTPFFGVAFFVGKLKGKLKGTLRSSCWSYVPDSLYQWPEIWRPSAAGPAWRNEAVNSGGGGTLDCLTSSRQIKSSSFASRGLRNSR